MSGFAVVYGDNNHIELEKMFSTIHHRGPDAAGTFTHKRIAMAQNYLKGDIFGPLDDILESEQTRVPVFDEADPEHKICYDGQMGNWQELTLGYGIPDGPFREERLLLRLYQNHGKSMFSHLNDAIFAFVISDGENLFAARDLLGIKPCFTVEKTKGCILHPN